MNKGVLVVYCVGRFVVFMEIIMIFVFLMLVVDCEIDVLIE